MCGGHDRFQNGHQISLATLYQDFVVGILSDYYILYVTEHGGFRKCTFPHDLENRMCDYFHLFAIYHHVPGSAIFRLMAAIKSKFRMYLPELHYYAPKHSIQTI